TTHGKIIKIIAPRRFGRECRSADFQTFQGRSRFGKEMLLDFARHAELLVCRLEFILGSLTLRDIANEGHEMPATLEFHVAEGNFDRKLQPILVAGNGLD